MDENIPPWVEVEDDLEGAEDPKVAEYQEEPEDTMSLPSRRKRSQGYPKI